MIGEDCTVMTEETLGTTLSSLARLVCDLAPDGFTFDPRLGRCLQPWDFGADDYVVSLYGHEKRFVSVPGVQDLRDWLAPNLTLLAAPDLYIGGWPSERDGHYYLDVSTVVGGKTRGLKVAREEQQQSIYHPSTNEVVWVSESVLASR